MRSMHVDHLITCTHTGASKATVQCRTGHHVVQRQHGRSAGPEHSVTSALHWLVRQYNLIPLLCQIINLHSSKRQANS